MSIFSLGCADVGLEECMSTIGTESMSNCGPARVQATFVKDRVEQGIEDCYSELEEYSGLKVHDYAKAELRVE
jgi:hypothetical protein